MLGKRGPKPGEGGRPIQYNDEFHRIQREIMREYRARLREQAVHSEPEVIEVLA